MTLRSQVAPDPGRPLRVLHVVTVCSPDMAFGGPLRVALNLCAELRGRGHAAVLGGGATGYPGAPPTRVEGIRSALTTVRPVLPGAKFSGLGSGRLLLDLARLIRQADLVHVHLCRDLVTMPAAVLALALRRPLVLHCHGMITPSRRRSARVYDVLFTRRVLRRADRVLVLTALERPEVDAVAGAALRRVEVVTNGVRLPAARGRMIGPRSDRLILFAARLADRKRPEAFVEMAELVRREVPDASFVLVGPDEGRAAAVRALVEDRRLGGAVRYLGPRPHAEVLNLMACSAVYVLPAVDEPFGMTVAEAMSVGTPVVVTDTCGLADLVRDADAGTVTGPAPVELAAAVVDLLTDRQSRLGRGRNAARATRESLDLTAAVDRIETVYAGVVTARRPPGDPGMLNFRERVRHHSVRYALRALLRPDPPAGMVRLGSDYGGWWIPTAAASHGTVAFCVGVGEDITFDLALHDRGCTVVAIDPVPRAAAHIAANAPEDDRFAFRPYGLAASDGVVAFFPPRDPAHVSYSMTNLQRTTVATPLPVRSLASAMAETGHDRIDILKLDIEGAEYEVLDALLADRLRPPVLCVEFDQPMPLRRTLRMTRRLVAAGYRVAKIDRFNVTFLRYG